MWGDSAQWWVFETGLILVSLGFGYFCGGLCAGMVLVWVGGGVRRDGLGHLDSEVAFHRSTCRSSIGSFLLRFMQNMADRICSAQLQLCFCSAVSIGCIKLSSQPFPISPLSEAGWLHCRDRPGLCSTKVPVPAKPPTDARTERTGHSQQSADTRKGIPDTGLRTILSRMRYFL